MTPWKSCVKCPVSTDGRKSAGHTREWISRVGMVVERTLFTAEDLQNKGLDSLLLLLGLERALLVH